MASYISVNASSYVDYIREPSDEDSWDRGDTSTDWYFGPAVVVSKDKSWDECVDFDIASGQKFYVVVAVYDTGDSFGWDKNGQYTVVDTFTDRELAEKCEAACYMKEVSYTKQNGELVCGSCAPWNGYFENLSYVTILEGIG